MLPVGKISEIKRRLRHGEPEGEIREQLKQEGYTEDDIASAFKPHYYDMRNWYLIFAVLITLAGLYNVLSGGGILIMLLGILLFGAYRREVKRLKKQ